VVSITTVNTGCGTNVIAMSPPSKIVEGAQYIPLNFCKLLDFHGSAPIESAPSNGHWVGAASRRQLESVNTNDISLNFDSGSERWPTIMLSGEIVSATVIASTSAWTELS
jgi:hypothetical protein